MLSALRCKSPPRQRTRTHSHLLWTEKDRYTACYLHKASLPFLCGLAAVPIYRLGVQVNDWSTIGRLSSGPVLHPQPTHWKPCWNDIERKDIQRRWARSALASLQSTESNEQIVQWNEISQIPMACARCAHLPASLTHTPTPLCSISLCASRHLVTKHIHHPFQAYKNRWLRWPR